MSDTEARFAVTFDVESMTTNEISAPLFEGDVALLSPKLPDALRIVSQGRQTRLFCTAPGSYPVKLDLIAKITRAEPWNQISFVGPPAAIASVTANASAPGIEMQLLSGTQLDPEKKATSRVSGFLGADRTLSLRWQSKTAEVTRRSLVTVDTAASAQITPTVIKFTTALRYEILQAAVPRLTIALPATHALTRIQGEQIRDWQVKPDGERQVLTVEFIKPVEKAYAVTLFSEQTVETTPLDRHARPAATARSRTRVRLVHAQRRRHHRGDRIRARPAPGQRPVRRAGGLPFQRPAHVHRGAASSASSRC